MAQRLRTIAPEVNGMIYWAPLLHFYQPPTQFCSVLDRISDECYRPLIRVFNHTSNARATFNVTGALTEILSDHGKTDIVAGLRALAEDGKIEFTGTGMYHPILPLIPPSEQRRQISLHQKISRRSFGSGFQPIGFFPPEMAIADNMIPAVVEAGHRWIVASGVANPGEWPLDFIPRIDTDDHDISIFFRDDLLSNQISFRELDAPTFFDKLRELRGEREKIYVVTAMDAETFGHHHRGLEEEFLAEAFRLAREPRNDDADDEIRICTVSDLLAKFPDGPAIAPKASSWSTTREDLEAGNAYPLWKDPGNYVHRLQWEVTQISADLVREAETLADNETSRHFARNARAFLDRALHSCQFWWASGRPMWEINMINRGLAEQQEAILNATRAIRSSGAPEAERQNALYRSIAARDRANRILDSLVD
jgi:predicted glycosyl hydrolase (DUF1957 family)